MSAAVQAWLAQRLTDVPPSLVQRMTAAAGDVVASDDASIPALLGEAALVCLRDAMPHCDERSAALDLLAADALITYACEAAADLTADAALESLCAHYAAERLTAHVDAS